MKELHRMKEPGTRKTFDESDAADAELTSAKAASIASRHDYERCVTAASRAAEGYWMPHTVHHICQALGVCSVNHMSTLPESIFVHAEVDLHILHPQ
jgi:hypothetical protein